MPQIFPAYNESDALIHPNDVSGIVGAAINIVAVTCTLEKKLFCGAKLAGSRE